ncbi:hypothetical protein JXJ21_01760 [candidate division KSB1 bacterium]|nr:hypothetical protein [candidate division KSB1 bacterium]
MQRSNLSRFIWGLLRLGAPGKKRLAMTVFRVFGHALAFLSYARDCKPRSGNWI